MNGFVAELGGIKADRVNLPLQNLSRSAALSELFTYDKSADTAMKLHIDAMKAAGDSVGGVVEVVVSGAPPGLGSYVQWDRKLDARLAMALMSIQAIKGVEVGIGFTAAALPGSKVHDEILYDDEAALIQPRTNRAGGIEGGMSNGEDIILRAAMKPIPTLYKPLKTIDINTKGPLRRRSSDLTSVQCRRHQWLPRRLWRLRSLRLFLINSVMTACLKQAEILKITCSMCGSSSEEHPRWS